MHHRVLFGLALGVFAAGCGGETQTAPTPAPAPTNTTVATATPPAPTTTSTGTTESAPPPPAKPPIEELAKKTLLANWAAFNGHDANAMSATYTADATFAAPGPEGLKDMSKDDTMNMFKGLFAGFSDLKMTATRVFQNKDVAVVEWVGTGTNDGEMMGEKPTKKKIGFHGATIDWFNDDGLIKREANYIDDPTIAQQLGKMPGKARAVEAAPSGDPQWVVAKNDDGESKMADWTKTASWPATWSKHDKKAYEATLNDDSAHYDYGMPNDWVGKKKLLEEYDMFAKAMPDSSVTVDNLWAAGNVAAFQFTFTGTMKGNLGPMKANNKPLTVHGLEIDEVKDGKITKGYTYSNSMEMLAQLGMLPKKKEAKATAAAPSTDKKPADKK